MPSLNEYISKCRGNKYAGAEFKSDIDELIGWAIIEAKAKGTVKPTCKPCTVEFVWHERTAKRDCDNIASAKKYILDAMQKQGIIPNDNQKYIKGFTDKFIKDTRNFVVVRLMEVQE